MTPTEAYYFAITKVNELREEGIRVTIKPSNSKNRNLDKIHGIEPELWKKISLSALDEDQANKLSETANYLGMCGIRFDTGGSPEGRDWEFDWSFHYEQGEENWEWKQAREEVEEMINQMSHETTSN